ncbi:MAG: 3-dehydroquinate synthase [Pyramidobacter sp.]|jgi:3-dehydroquinate synthase
MDSISVATRHKRYSVHIGPGLLSAVGELSLGICAAGTAMVVSDSNVAPLYGAQVKGSLQRAGFTPEFHVVPAGEASKNTAALIELLRHMARCGLTRGSAVFALGGGVTGDLAGLAASLYMRGLPFVQLPTSLLAAVDSSVGGKTAVDLEEGKNLVGTFYQPDLVLCDTDAFATLPAVQIANGFGEIVKTAMIFDAALFDLAAGADAQSHLQAMAARCVELKKSVVEGDELEAGPRQILNFGHTFGHAVEKCSGYRLPHGFCVAVGMALITGACRKRGICSAETEGRLRAALKARRLPWRTDYGAEEIFSAMLADKKRRGDRLTLIIPLEIGRAERRTVNLKEARAFLEDGLAAAKEAL